MGKSKKTRWRTFEISGSQADETQTNGADVKVNGTDSESHAPLASQKYSQILGDHHTNSSTQQNRNSSSNHIYRSRSGYNNNKENLYNQRSVGRPGVQRSWQRGGNYRTPTVNRRSDENDKLHSNDAKVDSTAEPIKFNEDEYTRITTPRQDVLFKKGYLSRMNNKTATTISSAPVNSADSTAASSTITTSDPDSSVSTLSPATTPSMDYGGQGDSMEYPPMYYPGYYDENGMLVIPMYNGYNYYPPNGSAATSPVYLMPYPYQYDPFFMTPTGMQPVDGEENAEDKTESDGAKENNQHAENQNGTRSTSTSEDGASSTHGEETKDEKKDSNELNGNEEGIDGALDSSEQKPSFPIYPNELNGYMYPAYPNGYYNNFYYYNGAPNSRPPKLKRRKRFLSSRNSQHHQPRSAETTTDYSDDDNTTHTKRFNPRYQNGWAHMSGFNHYNGKFHRIHVDQNGNQAPSEFHLNVDVQEFYPRVQSATNESVTKVNYDDLARTEPTPMPKQKVEAPKATTKPSQVSKSSAGRFSKKEIIEGIKSMEQQNIDLMATKPHTIVNVSQDDEWNVIKKGKKVKVVKDIKLELTSSEVKEIKVEQKVEEIKIEEPKPEIVVAQEIVKKASPPAPVKPKKSKSKNKKKKSHLMVKQDGFEIIEPDFNNSSTVEVAQELTDDEEDETVIESEIPSEPATSVTEVIFKMVLSEIEEMIFEPVVIVEQECAIEAIKSVAQTPGIVKEKTLEVNDLTEKLRIVNITDDVIDISDEDICNKVTIPHELASIDEKVEMENEPEVQVKAEVQVKSEVHKTPEVQVKLEARKTPEVQEKVAKELKQDVQLKLDVSKKIEVQPKKPIQTKIDPFQDMDFFNDRTNIAALERDLMENLRLLDDEIELKSPIINPLYDFPITSAVQKWLQTKQNESFDSLFHVHNLKKLSENFDDDDDDDDETESDISEKDLKSETDSDYASDFQAKANSGSPTCSTHAKSSEKSSKCNKLIAKESFCALM